MVPGGYLGLTFYPFIFLKTASLKTNRVLLNHERIHLQQQLELLIVPFYIIYVLEFLRGLIRYKNRVEAYRNISFEREAYANEKDLAYLRTRPLFSFIWYARI